MGDQRSWATPSIDASLGSDRSPYSKVDFGEGWPTAKNPGLLAIFARGNKFTGKRATVFSCFWHENEPWAPFPSSSSSASIAVRFNWMRSQPCHFLSSPHFVSFTIDPFSFSLLFPRLLSFWISRVFRSFQAFPTIFSTYQFHTFRLCFPFSERQSSVFPFFLFFILIFNSTF